MPPRDPRLRPDLERALPAGSDAATGYRMAREPWEALFGDGRWHPVQVRAWWLDSGGRQVVQVEWSAAGERWTGAYLHDPGKLRRAAE